MRVEPVGSGGAVSEVTDRRSAEALQPQSSVIEKMATRVFLITDAQERIVFVNAAFERIPAIALRRHSTKPPI
ncbi:MAG: hypothetical protein IPH35_18350 [Rhodoferax sp.]|nr:hypothetical protein [Rhodoferax sp.]